MSKPKIETVTLADGVHFSGYEGDYIFESIRERQKYFEQSQLEKWFLPRAERMHCIYDIGANLGNHSVYFATHSKAKVFSFEPMPVTFAMLKTNVEQNGLSDRITLFPFALGAEESSARMELMNNLDLGCASITAQGEDTTAKKLNGYLSANRKVVKDGKVIAEPFSDHNILKDLTGKDAQEVSVKRLDDLGLPPPDFVKIDVEEYELKTFKDMVRTLSESSPDLWIEIHGQLPDNKEKWALLGSLGYVPVDFDPPCDFIFSKTGTQESERFWSLLDMMHSAAMTLNHRYRERLQLMQEELENSRSCHS